MRNMSEQVIETIIKQFGVTSEKVTLETQFFRDLGADSLDIVELVMSLENDLGITISDEMVDGIRSVGDAIRAVELAKSWTWGSSSKGIAPE